MSKISSPCHTTYAPAYHQSGIRHRSEVTLVVMHDTESGATTAAAVASYFQHEAAGGSAHLVVDEDECYRCLPDSAIAWGAPGANEQGFHIEQCGYAAWTPGQWRRNLRMLKRAAYKAAHACHRFNIPPKFVKAKGLDRGHKGVTTHRQVSKWQESIGAPPPPGGWHTDPGLGWPRHLFMILVRHYYNQIPKQGA